MADSAARTSTSTLGARSTSGRESFAAGHIEQIQRARIIAAAVQAIYSDGAANLTVAEVVTRASISRRTFYELFSDCEDCLLAALDDAVARASAHVLPVYRAEQDAAWRVRIRAAVIALLEYFDEQRPAAYLLVVEWLAAEPRALEQRRRLLAALADAIDEGRRARGVASANPPQLTAEGLVGAVLAVLHARLQDPPSDRGLRELANPLMAMIVLPYLGAAAARKELEQPLPEPPATTRLPGGHAHMQTTEDVLAGLKMRLTYRTMRVLAAIAANPDSSNRIVAHAAGIADQGQVSKLLMRLSKLGLIENHGAATKGAPNAWVLTAAGERVERLLRS